MRIHVTHQTAYAYERPARYVIQKLRLSPRGHEGQHVRRWRIEVDHDCRLVERTDAFGNIVHTFTLTGAVERMTVSIEGEVETEDTGGLVRGTPERLPLPLFLRQTPLTEPDTAIRALAAECAARQGGTLDTLHCLMTTLHNRMKFDVGRTDAGTTAAESYGLGHGVCQDFAHIFIAAARSLAIPARYIGGYLVQSNGLVEQDAGHAWAEAHVDDLGWVGFDPANGVSITENYVRIAAGLDYLGAAPVRGTQSGGAEETLAIAVSVEEIPAQQ